MAQLRFDPLAGHWVIVAPERALRPQAPADHSTPVSCPFCEGNEWQTPHELAAVRAAGSAPDGPGWQARVVPNKYPAVSPAEGAGCPAPAGEPALFATAAAHGAHEVVVESPRHLVSSGDLSSQEFAAVLHLYRERLAALRHDPRLEYATVFKNVGQLGGATQEHTHSQILATPFVPRFVCDELTACRQQHEALRTCPFCRLIQEEAARGERVVLDQSGVVAVCPFASRLPYEVWVLPRSHASHFEDAPRECLLSLARELPRLLAAIDRLLGRPAYNYLLRTAPFRSPPLPYYHWHWQVLPRTTPLAGFELATGSFINAVPPEQAARKLRDAISQLSALA